MSAPNKDTHHNHDCGDPRIFLSVTQRGSRMVLSTDVVDNDLEDAAALRKAFLESIDDKKLFEEAVRFRNEGS